MVPSVFRYLWSFFSFKISIVSWDFRSQPFGSCVERYILGFLCGLSWVLSMIYYFYLWYLFRHRQYEEVIFMANHQGTPVLRGDRLHLRPLCTGDADSVFHNWASDPQVTKFLRWNPHSDIEVTKAWLSECDQGYRRPDFYDWGIELADTKTLIGSIGASRACLEPEQFEIGYCIAKAYWNHGYTTEALRLMMEYLIDTVGIRSFSCRHAKDNSASGSVMRKAGFQYQTDGTYTSFDGARTFACAIYGMDV